jgi:hypothetical protein
MQPMAVNAAKDIPGSNASTFHEATQPDLLTIAAIAIAATVIADFIHEGIGHGGMCAATGGRKHNAQNPQRTQSRYFNRYLATGKSVFFSVNSMDACVFSQLIRMVQLPPL